MTSVYEVRGFDFWLVERETQYARWSGGFPREPQMRVEAFTDVIREWGAPARVLVGGHRITLKEFTEAEEEEVMPLIQEALTSGDVSLVQAYIKFITREGNSDNDQAQ